MINYVTVYSIFSFIECTRNDIFKYFRAVLLLHFANVSTYCTQDESLMIRNIYNFTLDEDKINAPNVDTSPVTVTSDSIHRGNRRYDCQQFGRVVTFPIFGKP